MNNFITEDALASEFAARHEHRLRYVAKSTKVVAQRWLILNPTTEEWEPDTTLAVLELVRRLCREAAADCDDQERAWTIGSAATVSAVERLARCDPRLAAKPEIAGLPVKLRPTKRGAK
jgi:putative DNA primase/helicase